MTTDNTTPDPTPALLPPARLAEIRERADAPLRPMPDAEERAEYFGQAIADRAALLAHLDALTPRAVVDGEALGRGLFEHMSALAWPNGRGEIGGPGWDGLREDSRSYYIAAALALHAIGYAAGAVAMTGEGDDPGTEGAVLILMKRHDGELHEAHAAGRSEGEAERVRLSALLAAEHESAGVAIEGQQIEIARLTAALEAERARRPVEEAAIAEAQRELDATRAELAEARAAVEAFQRGSGCVDGYTIGEALAKIGASLNRTPTEGIPDAIERIKKEKAAARRDGAREEREECARIADAASRYNANRPANTQPSAAYKIADAIRARATEGRQGS